MYGRDRSYFGCSGFTVFVVIMLALVAYIVLVLMRVPELVGVRMTTLERLFNDPIFRHNMRIVNRALTQVMDAFRDVLGQVWTEIVRAVRQVLR